MKVYSAEEFLGEVGETLRQRGVTYDSPQGERSMEKAVQLFNLRTGHQLTETEGWVFLGYLKDVRQDQSGGEHVDSALDRIGYALLEAESRFREKMNR